MTRILHVIATLDRGGTEVSCLTLARAFARCGIENYILALCPGGRGIEVAVAEVAGPPVLLPKMRIVRMFAFRRHIRRLRPDAVIFHFFNIEHVFLGVMAQSVGLNNIITVQGNPAPPPETSALFRRVGQILRLSRFLGFKLVSASAWIEASLRDLGPLPKSSTVIHNGCEVNAIAKQAAAARETRLDNDKVIGMVARLDPIKDHATLIDAFAGLPPEIEGRRLVLKLIGDGVLRSDLEKRAQARGVSERVIFTGARSNIPSELGRMDVFVLSTTRDEGFGVVLIEALAAGVPVLASDVPATREVLTGDLGQLMPAADPVALRKALTAVLTTAVETPSISDVAKRYGADAMAEKYLKSLALH